MSAPLAFVLPLLIALAVQEPTPPPPAASDAYVVGPGDVLDVQVFGNPELTRTTTVQTSGEIALPLLGDVAVAGLTLVEVQRKLVTLLERDYLVNPQVEVKVREYQSQSVIVLGEVNDPGRKVIRGRTRLIDLLIDAGGFRPNASGEVVITRAGGGFEGKDTLQIQIGSGAMSMQDRINLEIPLQNGDLVNVLPKNHVTVEGEVAKPGRYAIDASSTLTRLVTEAGGLTRFGSNDVKIRRLDTQTGKVELLEFDLKDIRNGKKPDVALQPDDVIMVARRRF